MNSFFKGLIVVLMLAVFPTQGHAQFWKKVTQKLEKKAEDKIDNVLGTKDKDTGTRDTRDTEEDIPYVEEVFSFVPGGMLYYEDDLSGDREGMMPRRWKTNSSGSVTTVPGVPGKWLKMEGEASYQLDTLLAMPKNFTLEFDLLTRSDKAEDLRDIHFGFSRNNSTKSYIYNVSSGDVSAATELAFYYNTVNSTSYDTDTNNRLEYPLHNFSNSVIHISMAVEGQHMRVYLNRSKVLDTRMFDPETAKYFYISTDRMRNSARLYISNLRIAEL